MRPVRYHPGIFGFRRYAGNIFLRVNYNTTANQQAHKPSNCFHLIGCFLRIVIEFLSVTPIGCSGKE
jgi:hypothetical protein